MGTSCCCGGSGCDRIIEKIIVSWGDKQSTYIINDSVTNLKVIPLYFGNCFSYWAPKTIILNQPANAPSFYSYEYELDYCRDFTIVIECPNELDSSNFFISSEFKHYFENTYLDGKAILRVPDQRLLEDKSFYINYFSSTLNFSILCNSHEWYSDEELSDEFTYNINEYFKETNPTYTFKATITREIIPLPEDSVGNIGPSRSYTSILKLIDSDVIKYIPTPIVKVAEVRTDGNPFFGLNSRHSMEGMYITLTCSSYNGLNTTGTFYQKPGNHIKIKIDHHVDCSFSYFTSTSEVKKRSKLELYTTNGYFGCYSPYNLYTISEMPDCDYKNLLKRYGWAPPCPTYTVPIYNTPCGTSIIGVIRPCVIIGYEERQIPDWIENSVFSPVLNYPLLLNYLKRDIFSIINYTNEFGFENPSYNNLKTNTFHFYNPEVTRKQIGQFSVQEYDKSYYDFYQMVDNCNVIDNVSSFSYMYNFMESEEKRVDAFFNKSYISNAVYSFYYFYASNVLDVNLMCQSFAGPEEELIPLKIDIHFKDSSVECESKELKNVEQNYLDNKNIQISSILITDNTEVDFITNSINKKTKFLYQDRIYLNSKKDFKDNKLLERYTQDINYPSDVYVEHDLISVVSNKFESKTDTKNKYIHWDIDSSSLGRFEFDESPILHCRLSTSMPYGPDNIHIIRKITDNIFKNPSNIYADLLNRYDFLTGTPIVDLYFFEKIINNIKQLSMVCKLSLDKTFNFKQTRYANYLYQSDTKFKADCLNYQDKCTGNYVGDFELYTWQEYTNIAYSKKYDYPLIDNLLNSSLPEYVSDKIVIASLDDIYAPINMSYQKYNYNYELKNNIKIELFP